MNEKDTIKFYKKMRYFALNHTKSQYIINEFPSYAVQQFIQRGGYSMDGRSLFKDYLSYINAQKRLPTVNAVLLDDEKHSSDNCEDEALDLASLIAKLEPWEQKLIGEYLAGNSLRDIAKNAGQDESTAYLQYKNILERLQAAAHGERMRPAQTPRKPYKKRKKKKGVSKFYRGKG